MPHNRERKGIEILGMQVGYKTWTSSLNNQFTKVWLYPISKYKSSYQRIIKN